jgi:hypothetical protein
VSTRLVFEDRACADAPLLDEAGRLFVSIDTVRTHLDPSITWDQELKRAFIPLQGKEVRMATTALTEFVNRGHVSVNVPVTVTETGTPYVPADILAELYGLVYRHIPESDTVVIDRVGETVSVALASSDQVFVREAPSLLALRLNRLQTGDAVQVYGEEGNWYRVRDAAGRLGFVPMKGVRVGEPVVTTAAPRVPAPPRPQGKISLVWEHVTSRVRVPANIGPMPSLNVVSPTWFHVIDTDGTVQNLGDQAYVDWAHEQGYQVWGLVTNGFNQERTRAVLTSPAKREHMIRQLLLYAKLYKLDGINMDFENMYLAQKGDYVQFMRELVPLAHAQGLIVSVDVTFLSSSEAWSLCYDRRALGQLVDYVMVMGYDQHTGGSNVSGPVGAIPWVENGIQRVLQEVPAEKLVLGIPFYTRLWTEEQGKRPTVKTLWMQDVLDLIAEKKLTPTWDAANGHNYITWTEGGLRYKVWIEDEVSIASRVRLANRYGLAGVAAWRRGFELPHIWEVIERELGRGGG